jgi:hypothetical protein
MLAGFALCALGAVLALQRRMPEPASPADAKIFPRSATMQLLLGLTARGSDPRMHDTAHRIRD